MECQGNVRGMSGAGAGPIVHWSKNFTLLYYWGNSTLVRIIQKVVLLLFMMQKKGDMDFSMSPKQAQADYFQSPNQLMTFHLLFIRHIQSPYQYLIADRLETIWATRKRKCRQLHSAFPLHIRMWFRL